MALVKTPDGGFYVNDDEFEVNYSTNSISLTGQGGGVVAGVSSFNGRTGAVIPQDGDYTAEQVGAASTDTVNTMAEYIHDIVESVEPLPYLPETYTPPIATTDVTNKGYVDGVVKVVSDEVDGIIAGTTPISVPIATDTKVGGVLQAAGVTDATNADDIITQFNALLASLRTSGVLQDNT